MKKFTVTVEKEFTIEFDETSKEFQELWESYVQNFDKDAEYSDFVETIASHIARYGINEFIEGIGFVKDNGENQTLFHNGKYEEQESCVNVCVETDINDKVSFEISTVEEN